MPRTIPVWKNPYGCGMSLCKARKITINDGLTVLIGCNGAGKTTLLHNIQSELKDNKIPCITFDNMDEDSSKLISEAMFNDNHSLAGSLMCASEGEAISIKLGQLIAKLRKFMLTGDSQSRAERLAKIFQKENSSEEKQPVSNERWILFDAVDSGYSIDNIVELKDLFQLIIDDAKSHGIDAYIIVSANEYEMASSASCFDVISGKYININSYEEFKAAILASRKKKDKRFKND
ncbi:hypothetical protein J6A31_09070 [bacterium]|nr:hypothetical protein [bacterium]